MKRTTEKVLSIIAIVLNAIGLLSFAFMMLVGFVAYTDDSLINEIEEELIVEEPDLTAEDIEYGIELMEGFMGIMMGFSGVIIVAFIIAIILTIIGVVKIDKNAKTAGILFLIAALFSAIISLQGILLMIAGIMALVRKPKADEVVKIPNHE